MNEAQFVDWVEKNEKRVSKGYKLGHDGHDGWCDCIGLIIGAWRMAENKWPWTHGSNYTARHLTNNLGKDQPLNLGDLVYKGRQPGDAGYKLPDQYKKGKDLTDYYHVGVVTSVSPLTIAHCTSGNNCRVWDGKAWVNLKKGGIKWDTARGTWKYSGQFSKLEGRTLPDILYVTSPNGQPVNMRQLANVTSSIVAKVPVGEQVNVLGVTDTGWTHVTWKKYTGWMMSKFLIGEQEPDSQPSDGNTGEIGQEEIEALKQALNIIKSQAEKALALLEGTNDE